MQQAEGKILRPQRPVRRGSWYDRDPLVALAPMEAITDHVFRALVRRLAPEVVLYTEFVPAQGLLRGGERIRKTALFDEDQRPVVVQLYDHDPPALGEAAKQVAGGLQPDGIDINMGCPVRKIAARGAGCGMMENPEKAAEAVRIVVDNACGLPVSVKMRLGVREKTEAIEVAERCIEAGAELVAVHARLKTDRQSEPADWEALAKVAENICVAVIGNGDIRRPEDAVRMCARCGADGVMIGRGAIGNPWLLRRAWQALAGIEVDPPPEKEERVRIALEHLEMNVREKGERRGMLEMRKMIRNYIKGFPDSRRTWLRIIAAETSAETAAILTEFAGDESDGG